MQRAIYDEDKWFVGDGPPSPETLAARLRSLNSNHSLYLVALKDGELSGWLELHRLAAKRLNHVAILTLAVAKTKRRGGLGANLLRGAYDWARQVGVLKLTLNVRENNVAAIRLYESEGFELEGREHKHVRTGAGFEDNLIMAKQF